MWIVVKVNSHIIVIIGITYEVRDLPEKSLNFFHWVHTRARAPTNLFLDTFARARAHKPRARGPKEKSLKFEHWLSKIIIINKPTTETTFIPLSCGKRHVFCQTSFHV